MPIKNKSHAMYPVFVLFFGLISCSPEQPKKDSLTIQEPEIIVEKRNPIKISAVEPSFTWSAQDRIRFQQVDGLKLSVRSSCSSAQSSEVYEDSQIRPMPKELFIAELLPPAMLARINPLELKQFHCSFAFAAINDKGSQHRFKIPPRLFEDRPESHFRTNLHVNGAAVETPWPILDSSNLAKFWVISPNAKQFQLRCTDLQITTPAATDIMAVSEMLKYTAAEKIQSSIQRAPTQSCRVLAFQNGLLQGWSPFFKIDWSASKLEIQVARTLNNEFWPQTIFGSILGLYDVQIKNPFPFPIYFSIPDQKTIWVFSMRTNEVGFKFQQPFSINFNKNSAGLILNEKKPSRLGLNAGAQITFSLKVQFTNVCGLDQNGYAYPFHSLSALKIKRFLNMTDDVEVGLQDFVPPKIIGIKSGRVSAFSPSFSASYNPPGC